MWPDSPFHHAPWIHHIRSSTDLHSSTVLPGPITYCSMKSDQTGAQTQTLLELHQMLYHWAIRSSRVSQCDRIPHFVKPNHCNSCLILQASYVDVPLGEQIFFAYMLFYNSRIMLLWDLRMISDAVMHLKVTIYIQFFGWMYQNLLSLCHIPEIWQLCNLFLLIILLKL